MANWFLQRLFAEKKRNSDAKSLTLSESAKSPVQPEAPSSDVANQKSGKPPEPPTVDQNAETKKKLFAFVDLKDPFTPSEIAGEELLGPILSILSATRFDSVLLFHTPQTRENAFATATEIARRHTGCLVKLQELLVSDPKDYSSVMGGLWRYCRDSLRRSEADENYVCVSSGTAEMRAAWFLLTTLGVVQAKLLQVGTPASPVFGKENVKELRIDTADTLTIQALALPVQSSITAPRELVADPQPTTARKWWPRPREKKPDDKLLQETFEKTLLGQFQRVHGEIPKSRLTLFRDFARQEYRKLKAASPHVMTSADSVRHLAHEFFRQRMRTNPLITNPLEPFNQAAFLGAVANSVPYEEMLEGQPSAPNQIAREPEADAALKRSPEQLLLRAKSSVAHGRAEKGTAEEAKKALKKAAEEEESILMGEPEEPESPNEATKEAPADEEELQELVLGGGERHVPGLDDALQELGIYVGSAVLRHAAERAGIAAGSHLPVLLLGETGTGKERFAHLIHRLSPRFPRELVAINCAAIPEPIAESYLFGHMRGAFTGADRDKKGMFECADQSTLFLDEIAELTLEMQAKLLRVIQDGMVQRLGSTTPKKVDVRIVAASNRDLKKEVSSGRFREDLYFRLEVVQIKLPALRERLSEIPELAIALLRQINLRRHKPRQLSSAALRRLEQYHWPGNVRQLSNVLERSILFALADIIQVEDLDIIEEKSFNDPFVPLPELSPGFKVDAYITQVREQIFLRVLAACKGNRTEAAERLGVSKQAVSKFVAGQIDNVD